MSRRRRIPDEERRKLFRRMEWAFVWAPPLLIVLITFFGAAFMAFFVPLEGTTFWGRWAIAAGLILGVPLIGYTARELWRRRK